MVNICSYQGDGVRPEVVVQEEEEGEVTSWRRRSLGRESGSWWEKRCRWTLGRVREGWRCWGGWRHNLGMSGAERCGGGGCWRIGFWSPAYLFRQEPPQCCLVYFWLLGLSVLSKISRMWSWVKPLLWIIQGFMLCKKPNRKYLVVSLPNSLYNPLKHIT